VELAAVVETSWVRTTELGKRFGEEYLPVDLNEGHYGAPDGSAAIATSLIGVPSARSHASTSATLRFVLIVTFRPEYEAPWIGRPYVTCLTINRLAAREVGAMIDGASAINSLLQTCGSPRSQARRVRSSNSESMPSDFARCIIKVLDVV
jgi:hypothetical protein